MRLYSSINYPRCTISTLDHHDSDCGSVGWAYTLFIAWNILSMVRSSFCPASVIFFFFNSSHYQYIFVNMFTGETHSIHDATWKWNLQYLGLVVENFSYVYQTTGGAKSVTREEMRAFKKVWAEFANPRTELLERAQLVPFFGVSFYFIFELGCGRPRVVIETSCVRNWAVSLKSESTRPSLVFGTYWLLVRIRPIPTLRGGLAPDPPTALTSGY